MDQKYKRFFGEYGPYLILFLIFCIVIFFDNYLIQFSQKIRIGFLNPLFTFLGGAGGLILLIIIVSLFFWLEKKEKLPIWLASLLLAGALGLILKYLILRPRPFLVEEITPLLYKSSPSFPSNHANLAATFLPFFSQLPQTKWWALILSLLIMMTGYYNGVHYLGDVLGGILVGSLTGHLLNKKLPPLFNKWLKKTKP